MTKAVVLGGGMAGMLAASVLAERVDRVTIVESDTFPGGPQARRGLPQGHHFHMFMGGGVDALDELLPGMSDALYLAGAHRRRFGDEFLGVSGNGWGRPYDGRAYVLACSRPLLDHMVRTRVLADDRIEVLPATKAIGLLGDRTRVTGVRVESSDRSRAGAGGLGIAADLVIDATGRTSHAPEWLTELGAPRVHMDTQDAGFAYAGRTYEAPTGAGVDFPAILVQADAGTGRPGRGGGILPNEDGRWIVAMIGTRGGHPPTDEAGYLEYARGLADPLIGELLAAARPVTEIRAYRGLVNQRRYYDRLPVPEGFLVVGDAAMTLNPNYATGMSMAAFGALELRDELGRHGLTGDLTRRVQTAIGKAGSVSWLAATTNDSWFPGSEANFKLRGAKAQKGFVQRWNRVAAENADVARATYEVATFLAPRKAMMTLPLMLTVMRGPRLPQLTLDEAIRSYPNFADPLAKLDLGVGVPGAR
ncbi:hypothetical protein ACWT_5924 [Actinoplanes sp. SE50]|uniref:NAD(P)/FAD-dependent oxidoreductase n=1 Tax=unclassified Actinoplanes TaxID=2626549 RepID=UPI00023EC15C|nr:MULTISPECIES: FAD-dependent oxidoreductase [unclassified Actinoplanes]AEV86943.1 hypothetical protein ACPL_6056 [Actinoplanes sp. SE50/110]ATO85339.1 hypothetical protein ACWT_5924 [Actinoplanes sp. SE50]SLM02750.1 uncharacterized protein ACSP50_6035 [Actinoplanes sp. SE50/110]